MGEESASKTFKQKLINAFLKDQKSCHITILATKNQGWDQNYKYHTWRPKSLNLKKRTIFVSDKIRNQKCNQAKPKCILHFINFEVVLY